LLLAFALSETAADCSSCAGNAAGAAFCLFSTTPSVWASASWCLDSGAPAPAGTYPGSTRSAAASAYVDGLVTISANPTYPLGDLTVGSAGSLTFGASIDLAGITVSNGGTITLNSGFTLLLAQNAAKLGTVFTNNALIIIMGKLQVNTPATFENSGIFAVYSTGSVFVHQTTFTNTGNGISITGTMTTDETATLTNDGDISINSGGHLAINTQSQLVNSHIVDIRTGGKLTLTGGTVTNQAGDSILIRGELSADTTSTVTNNGIMQLSTGGTFKGTLSGGSNPLETPPAFTSANSATFTQGSSNSFSFQASGTPSPNFVVQGSLPSGVHYTSAGVLSGDPSTTGSYPITILALNTVGEATQSFTLTVDA